MVGHDSTATGPVTTKLALQQSTHTERAWPDSRPANITQRHIAQIGGSGRTHSVWQGEGRPFACLASRLPRCVCVVCVCVCQSQHSVTLITHHDSFSPVLSTVCVILVAVADIRVYYSVFCQAYECDSPFGHDITTLPCVKRHELCTGFHTELGCSE